MKPTNKNREKFIELAEKRVIKAIKDIRLIANLSNRANYAYNEQDVRKIFNTLNNEIKQAKAKFSFVKQNKTFKL
ncbi:MAG: hypothetical protein ACE5GV_15570 [Candidatus Scalindua sp.]